MIRERTGMAAIIDALVFLAIASIVSVSLLAALGAPSSHPDDRPASRVISSHIVLLRTTIADSSGNPCTLEDLFKLESVDVQSYEDNLTLALGLLLPSMEWRWTVEHEGCRWTFGSEAVPSGDLFCSIVRAPFDGSEIEYRLEAWYTYT